MWCFDESSVPSAMLWQKWSLPQLTGRILIPPVIFLRNSCFFHEPLMKFLPQPFQEIFNLFLQTIDKILPPTYTIYFLNFQNHMPEIFRKFKIESALSWSSDLAKFSEKLELQHVFDDFQNLYICAAHYKCNLWKRLQHPKLNKIKANLNLFNCSVKNL